MSVQSKLESFVNDRTLQPYPVWEYSFSETSTVKFLQSVRDACAANLCGNYGKSWACPPGIGDWKKIEKEINDKYKKVFVYTTKHDIEDWLDFDSMNEARTIHNKNDAVLYNLIKDEPEKFRIYGTEGCDLCAKCTYPDAPCRFPDRANRSMEATGMSVVDYAKDHGIKYINGENTVTYFTAVFYN